MKLETFHMYHKGISIVVYETKAKMKNKILAQYHQINIYKSGVCASMMMKPL